MSRMSVSCFAVATLLLGVVVGGLLPASANAQDRDVSPAKQSVPASFAELERQVLQHRAIEAVIWGMPAVNRDLM